MGTMCERNPKFEKLLLKMERTPEYELRKKLFGKSKYIDTGGFYAEEKKNYEDVIDFEKSVMGEGTVRKLCNFFKRNPKKVNKFLKSK